MNPHHDPAPAGTTPPEDQVPPPAGFGHAAPSGEELEQAPSVEYAYIHPVGEGQGLPPGDAHEAPSAAEPFPVLEPDTIAGAAAPVLASYEAGYDPASSESALPPAEEPTPYTMEAAASLPSPGEGLRDDGYRPPEGREEDAALLCEGLERFLGVAEARVHVLRGVSLRLEPGYVHAVVGPSGCGKSSLLYILGLLDRPDAGRLVISGRPVANLADDDLSRQRSALLGFIFQFHFLLQDFTALENIMIPMRQLGVLTEGQMRERATHLLDAVGLADKGHRASRHLSGGEQQRVAIARALANDPQVILADEPTGNLDTANSTRVFSLLTDLVHRENKALLLVTHNPAIAEACDWVHTMRDGLIVNQQYVGARR